MLNIGIFCLYHELIYYRILFFYFRFVLHYFDVNPAPFDLLDNSVDTIIPVKKQNRRKFSYISEVSEYDMVVACYNILQSAINHFKHKWNWSRFYKYLTNADDRVKW